MPRLETAMIAASSSAPMPPSATVRLASAKRSAGSYTRRMWRTIAVSFSSSLSFSNRAESTGATVKVATSPPMIA